MKKILTIILLSLAIMLGTFNFTEAKSTRVRGYYKSSNGSFIQPYYRSAPNRIKFDNWSAKGNYNPYTGKKGYRSW